MITLDKIETKEKKLPNGRILITAAVLVKAEGMLAAEELRWLPDARRKVRHDLWQHVYGDLVGPACEMAALAKRNCRPIDETATLAACDELLRRLTPTENDRSDSSDLSD